LVSCSGSPFDATRSLSSVASRPSSNASDSTLLLGSQVPCVVSPGATGLRVILPSTRLCSTNAAGIDARSSHMRRMLAGVHAPSAGTSAAASAFFFLAIRSTSKRRSRQASMVAAPSSVHAANTSRRIGWAAACFDGNRATTWASTACCSTENVAMSAASVVHAANPSMRSRSPSGSRLAIRAAGVEAAVAGGALDADAAPAALVASATNVLPRAACAASSTAR
jgi:hypothetical protein